LPEWIEQFFPRNGVPVRAGGFPGKRGAWIERFGGRVLVLEGILITKGGVRFGLGDSGETLDPNRPTMKIPLKTPF